MAESGKAKNKELQKEEDEGKEWPEMDNWEQKVADDPFSRQNSIKKRDRVTPSQRRKLKEQQIEEYEKALKAHR